MQKLFDLENPFVAPAAGALVIVVGLAMLAGHVRAWRKQQADPALDELARIRCRARFRRRMQASGLIVLIGVMIPVGDWLFMLEKPLVSTLYWLAVLVLIAWLVLLALGDMASTSAYSRTELARLQEQQRALERQLAELRSHGSNGKKPSGE